MRGYVIRDACPRDGDDDDDDANANLDQVNDRDDEDPVGKSLAEPKPQHDVPASPPPSFHSRASSPNRRGSSVDTALADAFDADDASDEDDDADDRQRLVRQTVSPLTASPGHDATRFAAPVDQAEHIASSASRPRVVGGGNGTDGVFANLSARPERRNSEKEEQPPVSNALASYGHARRDANVTRHSRTSKPPPTPPRRTGRRPSWRPASAG